MFRNFFSFGKNVEEEIYAEEKPDSVFHVYTGDCRSWMYKTPKGEVLDLKDVVGLVPASNIIDLMTSEQLGYFCFPVGVQDLRGMVLKSQGSVLWRVEEGSSECVEKGNSEASKKPGKHVTMLAVDGPGGVVFEDGTYILHSFRKEHKSVTGNVEGAGKGMQKDSDLNGDRTPLNSSENQHLSDSDDDDSVEVVEKGEVDKKPKADGQSLAKRTLSYDEKGTSVPKKMKATDDSSDDDSEYNPMVEE
jgi:hypothetical protein